MRSFHRNVVKGGIKILLVGKERDPIPAYGCGTVNRGQVGNRRKAAHTLCRNPSGQFRTLFFGVEEFQMS